MDTLIRLKIAVAVAIMAVFCSGCEVAFRVNTIDRTHETIQQTNEAWYCHVFVCSAADLKRDQERE